MPLNKVGAYICQPCVDGDHLGVGHGGTQHALCQCACDGRHDRRGNLVESSQYAPRKRHSRRGRSRC